MRFQYKTKLPQKGIAGWGGGCVGAPYEVGGLRCGRTSNIPMPTAGAFLSFVSWLWGVKFGIRRKKVGHLGPTFLYFRRINGWIGDFTVLMAGISVLMSVAPGLMAAKPRCLVGWFSLYFHHRQAWTKNIWLDFVIDKRLFELFSSA